MNNETKRKIFLAYYVLHKTYPEIEKEFHLSRTTLSRLLKDESLEFFDTSITKKMIKLMIENNIKTKDDYFNPFEEKRINKLIKEMKL